MKKILLSALVFVASTFAAHAIEGELSGRFTIKGVKQGKYIRIMQVNW